MKFSAALVCLLAPAVFGSAIFEDPEVEPSLPTILPEPEVPTATILPEPTEFEDEPMDCKTLSNLTYNELAAMHVWPMVSKASEVYANILSVAEDITPQSEILATAADITNDAMAATTLFSFAYPIVPVTEEKDMLLAILGVLNQANKAVDMFQAATQVSLRQVAIQRLRMLATMRDAARFLSADKVEEYLSNPSKHHMHLRSRKALPGHFWGQYVPTTLPSSEMGGIANMASLIDIYMHEAQRLWSESTGEEAPEVKLMESLFRHMTYRLDSTATVARLFPCVFKNPEAGEDILNQVTEFRAKEAQIANGLRMYEIFEHNHDLERAEATLEQVTAEWESLRQEQSELAPAEAFSTLADRVHNSLDFGLDEPKPTKWWKYLLWGLFILLVIPAIVFAAMWVRNKYFAGKSDYQPIGQQ